MITDYRIPSNPGNLRRPRIRLLPCVVVAIVWFAACFASLGAEDAQILSPSPGTVVTATPLKVTIQVPERKGDSFGATLNGKAITTLFTSAQDGKSSALLRRRNLRAGQNVLRVRYADHETSAVEFLYSPQIGAGPPGAEAPSGDYLTIHTRLVGGAGVNPGDYYTQVGSTRYVAPDGNGVTGFHVVALDRGDGSLKFNIVVPSEPPQYPYFALLASTIESQAAANCTGEWGCILIISSMQTIGLTCPANRFPCILNTSFDPGLSMALLGGTYRLNFIDGTRTTNSYSMITTIGQYGQSPPGSAQAYERLACQSSDGCLQYDGAPNAWTGYGDIEGALVADNNNALTFTPVSRPSFSLHATPNANDVNTITVNGQAYDGSLNGDSGGFHILILDASNLGVSFNYAIGIHNGGLNAILNDLYPYLQGPGSTQNILVFIASMGSMDHSNDPGTWLKVAELFSQFGATYHLISGLQYGDDYAMVGAPLTDFYFGPPTAVEASSVITRQASMLNPLPPTQLIGFLKQNHFGYYRPGASNLQYDTPNVDFSNAASSIETALLDKIALQAPVSWPICNDCSSTDGSNGLVNAYQAISYYLTVIGNSVGNPDIRSIYPQDEGSAWSQYQTNVQNLKTSGDLQTWLKEHEPDKSYLMNFSDSDFSTVQSQLASELAYVVLIHGYEQNVSNAVNQNETNLEFEIRNIYDELASDLQVSTQSQSPVYADIVGAIAGGLSIASYATADPAVNLALDAFSVGLSYSMSLTNQQNGVPIVADQLRSTVANLEVDTNNSFTSSLQTMANMFSLIYADWGRLQALGAALGNNPAPLINWTAGTANSYVQTMAKSMGGQFVGAFFSTLYNVYVWQDLTSGGPPGKNYLAVCNAEGVSSGDCPLGQHFDGSDWLNVRDKPNGQSVSDGNDGNYWNVLLIADQNAAFYGDTTECFEGVCQCQQKVDGDYPFDSVMQKIFAPIGAYPDSAANLGIYPLWFFTKYGIPQKPFFPHTGCTSSDN